MYVICYQLMRKKHTYFISGFVVLFLLIGILFGFKDPQENFSEKVKVTLRVIGHQLLLTNNDSVSLVLPIVEINENKFQLSFENKFSIEPQNLVLIVETALKKASLPANYLVEVKQCLNKEVVYSYQMKRTVEKSIIPCFGRFLEMDCYVIELHFTDTPSSFSNIQVTLIVLMLLVFLFVTFFYYKNKSKEEIERSESKYKTIGCFKFYPYQNKLVKATVEISLSKKECELLTIFIETPNQVIKREELMKRVWEDHGVIVGRSLDTYISKLRKKLKEDTSIKLTNVHGVGYKLEFKR